MVWIVEVTDESAKVDVAGHDVAENMLDSGLSSITMAQRGNTCKVTSSASL